MALGEREGPSRRSDLLVLKTGLQVLEAMAVMAAVFLVLDLAEVTP